MNTLTMSEAGTILPYGTFQVLHVALQEKGRVYAGTLENFQSLPDAFNRNCNLCFIIIDLDMEIQITAIK